MFEINHLIVTVTLDELKPAEYDSIEMFINTISTRKFIEIQSVQLIFPTIEIIFPRLSYFM